MVYFTFFLFLASSRLIAGQDASDPLPTSIAQSNTSMNQPQEIVGWVGNPRQRGTLALLIECLTTIFACTWTVLHLNLPAPKDAAITRVLRRIKWMAITILFPEFIFAKAVCELRLALHTSRLFYEKMNSNPDAFKSTVEYKSGESDMLKVVWGWKAENGRMIRWLHKLLVGRQKLLRTDINKNQEASARNHASDEYRNARTHNKTQVWTLSHSYYLNMGGIYGFERVKEYGSSTWEPIYGVIRGDYLEKMDLQSAAHIFQELRLSENEIKDKSKADWIGRTVAILQIGRLGLDAVNRAVDDRPVTQIELATVAFAIFAIVTYLINWWKPKDISEPTFLHAATRGIHVSDVTEDSTEPFFIRLLYPAGFPSLWHASTWRTRSHQRINNDELWMDGTLPLIWPLMAASCLVFGGFHCIAWSFQFPTWSEQLTWRVASLASMFLPVIALAGTSLIIQSCNGALIRRQIRAAAEVVKAFTPLEGLPQEYFSYFSEGSVSRAPLPERELEVLKGLEQYLKIGDKIRGALSILKGCRHGSSKQAETLNRSVILRLSWWFSLWQLHRIGPRFGQHLQVDDLSTNDLCQIIDRFEQTKTGTNPEENVAMANSIPIVETFLTIRTCMSQYDKYNKKGELYEYKLAKKRLTDRARMLSRPVNIVSGVLYTAARVALLGLMFSSLRAVPKGVYETSDWTRYLPSFS